MVPAGALQDKNGGLVRGGTRRGDVQDRSPGYKILTFASRFLPCNGAMMQRCIGDVRV